MTQSYQAGLVDFFMDPQLGGRTINASNGQVICDANAPADHIYFVNRGQVRVYASGPNESRRLVEILGAGEWFGTAALAGAMSHQIKVVAVGAAVVTEVRVDRLLTLLSRNPAQMLEFNRQLALKLLAETEQVGRLVFEDCNHRLIGALVRFSQSAASSPRDDGVVLRITHDQLAQAIGVARETVSLALTQLRQRNLLRTGRNQLMFNPDMLRRHNENPQLSDQIENVA
jgi:CRP-like cAMP-binding protein